MLFGCVLIIVSCIVFFHHTSALDEHAHHLHGKPMFQAVVVPVTFESKRKSHLIDEEAKVADTTVREKEVGIVNNPTLVLVDQTVAPTVSPQPKNLDFSVSPKCNSMLVSSKAMLQMWSNARKELGMPRSIDHLYHAQVKRFYAISFGVLTITARSKPMTFTMIWKCANDAIRKNMMMYQENQAKKYPEEINPSMLQQLESHSTAKYLTKLKRVYGMQNYPKAFTFSREPISHFISGLSEYYWRNYKTSFINADMLKQKLDGMFDFRELNERRDSVIDKSMRYVLWHFFVMAGILRANYNIGYLGKLESFDEDWARVNEIYGVDIQVNRSLGWHESSDDPNGVKSAFKELFQRDVRYKKALCQLLLVDYVCFKYDLPPECNGTIVTDFEPSTERDTHSHKPPSSVKTKVTKLPNLKSLSRAKDARNIAQRVRGSNVV